MSLTEIIRELPNLTDVERRTLRRKLQEFAEEEEDVALCDAMALEGALLLEEMETRNAHSSQG